MKQLLSSGNNLAEPGVPQSDLPAFSAVRVVLETSVSGAAGWWNLRGRLEFRNKFGQPVLKL